MQDGHDREWAGVTLPELILRQSVFRAARNSLGLSAVLVLLLIVNWRAQFRIQGNSGLAACLFTCTQRKFQQDRGSARGAAPPHRRARTRHDAREDTRNARSRGQRICGRTQTCRVRILQPFGCMDDPPHWRFLQAKTARVTPPLSSMLLWPRTAAAMTGTTSCVSCSARAK